ncbi:Mu transposase C-terminal domain-containing protein [Cupriavidus basilensis]|uniref:Mu transposase C-terminal domain-containing protein n=1 Tax=Cupriavidus basilensis TaxID=68895 RepID=UPI0023E87916|nr:Mu transposase C-terminal domain-containing protein [Cupriavidus basilensis]MDF3887904.1 Mu transposase C-terminal domain-containing protein [Cupriavidus basilensis]
MNRSLLLHDRLAPPRNHDAYLEVLDTHPHAGCIKVFDAEKRADRYIELASLLSDIHAGKLTVLRAGKPRFSHAAQPDDQHLHERNRFVQTAIRRIHDIQRRQGISFLEAYRRAAEEYRQEATPKSPPFPSQPTMYRYRKSEMAGLPVLRGNKNKGNRSPRYSQEVVNTICTVAEQHYLVPHSRWSLKRVTEEVNRQVRSTFLPMPCRPISIRYVKNTILRYVSADPEHDRMLPMDAVAGKSFAKKRIRAEAPFERVEQDALHLPFVAQTPSGVTSQVYLVHAIDCCTSYPLGWRLVVGAPIDTDSLACVEMYMAPLKKKRFEELGIDHAMNVCGTPGQLIFDNGAEAKGGRIQNLERLGVDVKHCRARAGQEKPFIERLNRSLKEAMEGLAGCTRLDGKDGQRDPIALGEKLPTLEELERWIVRWYYEKWVHTPLERLQWDVVLTDSLKGNTPAERWKHFEASCFAISLPPSRSEWLAALYEHKECRLSRKTGITIDGLHYKGNEIGALITEYGEQRPLRVLYNPDDFRHVYVYEGDDFPLVTLPNEHLRPETPAWSFNDAKERFKNQKSRFKLAPQAEKFDQDMHEKVVADSLAPKRKKPSKYERNRETARRDRETRAVTRASRQPGPLPPPPACRPKKVSEEASSAAQPAGSIFDDAALLPVLDRANGDELI